MAPPPGPRGRSVGFLFSNRPTSSSTKGSRRPSARTIRVVTQRRATLDQGLQDLFGHHVGIDLGPPFFGSFDPPRTRRPIDDSPLVLEFTSSARCVASWNGR